MPKTTTALETPLREQLDRLATFEATDLPVISLYLDMRRDQNGRAQHAPFLRKAFPERGRALTGDAKASFDADVTRISDFLDNQVRKSAQGVAIFACSKANDFFEAVQLDTPIEGHSLFIGPVPHLYPLALVNDQFRRYAALAVNTNSARLFVFGLASTETQEQVSNTKTRRSQMGGWSQARYQRHVENFHLKHMKEVVELLDRTVREEALTAIIVACDEVTKPTLMEQLPKHLAEKVVDVVNVAAQAPEHEILEQTLAVMRKHDAETDVERVQGMLDAWRGSGLGTVGPDATLRALSLAQVEELLIAASPDALSHAAGKPDQDLSELANDLVTQAQQQSARIRFIEDATLLQDVGGVGAILRFKI